MPSSALALLWFLVDGGNDDHGVRDKKTMSRTQPFFSSRYEATFSMRLLLLFETDEKLVKRVNRVEDHLVVDFS